MSNLTKEHDFFHLRDKCIRKHWCHTFKKKKYLRLVIQPDSDDWAQTETTRCHAGNSRRDDPVEIYLAGKAYKATKTKVRADYTESAAGRGEVGGETRGQPQPQLIQEVTKDHSRTSKESQTSQPRAALTAKNRIQGRVAKRKPSHLKAFRKMFYEGKSKKTEFLPDDSLVQGWDI